MKTNDYEKVEQLINLTFHRPSISGVHKKALQQRILSERDKTKVNNATRLFVFRPVWRFASGLLVLICLIIVLIGPAKVWAQIAKWLGYASPIGLISEPDSVMNLAEPIHLTTENYSVLIPNAVLSSDRTLINYLIFQGTDPENKPDQNCPSSAYLTVHGKSDKFYENARGQFPALPRETDEVLLNIPCITQTAGNETTPIVLKLEKSNDEYSSLETGDVQTSMEEGVSGTVKIDQVFLEQNDVVLVTKLVSRQDVNEHFHISGVPVIHDADGKTIAYESPLGTEAREGNQETPIHFNFKFSSIGVKFPVIVRFSVKLTKESTDDLYLGKSEDWSVQWAPASANLSEEYTTCITAGTIRNLESAPILANAAYLVRGSDGSWEIYDNLAKSTVIANDALEVKISPDRKMAAVVYPNRFVFKHLSSGEETRFIGSYSANVFWNAESNEVALQGIDKIEILSIHGNVTTSIPLAEGGLLAGWISSDTVLYGTPELSGKGYLLRSMSLNDKVSDDLFYLDHSAGKNINLSISPDRQWVAYRGEKQATLYIKNLETGEVKQIMNAPTTLVNPAATDNFFWVHDTSELVVEIKLPNEDEFAVFIIEIEKCNMMSVPEFSGEIMEVLPNRKSN